MCITLSRRHQSDPMRPGSSIAGVGNAAASGMQWPGNAQAVCTVCERRSFSPLPRLCCLSCCPMVMPEHIAVSTVVIKNTSSIGTPKIIIWCVLTSQCWLSGLQKSLSPICLSLSFLSGAAVCVIAVPFTVKEHSSNSRLGLASCRAAPLPLWLMKSGENLASYRLHESAKPRDVTDRARRRPTDRD